MKKVSAVFMVVVIAVTAATMVGCSGESDETALAASVRQPAQVSEIKNIISFNIPAGFVLVQDEGQPRRYRIEKFVFHPSCTEIVEDVAPGQLMWLRKTVRTVITPDQRSSLTIEIHVHRLSDLKPVLGADLTKVP